MTTVVATIRPHSWDFPLFLHVLGATMAFGAIVTLLLVRP